jgi:tetratricopeptide (TPR) repeat protein
MTDRKLFLFRLAAFIIPVIAIFFIEGLLHVIDYGQRPALFVPAQLDFTEQKYLMVNTEVAERYFPKHGFVPIPPHELLLREKAQNGYRIFILGGSTAAGWPYPNNVLFSRILRQRLADTFPDREIEIINTGIAAVNTYTLLDFMDEILKQQPDAILIYAGHNEFYGAYGAASTISFSKARWVVKFYLTLQRFKTVQMVRGLIENIRIWMSSSDSDERSYHPTLMSQVIDQKNILFGSSVYERGKRQFQDNLRDILNRAEDAGVPVIVSELVSNIRDHKPFVSEGTSSMPPAGDIYEQARFLERESKLEEARKAYYRAKDLDAMRLRASEDFNEIIHKVAKEYGIPVVPMKSYFEGASPNRLIGNSLVLEHLHPNIEGHFIMSEAFFDTMHQYGFIEKQWETKNMIPASSYRKNWGITELDRALGNIRIINLMDHWPFKPEGASSKAARNFVPASRSEALAKRVFLNRISFKNAHRAMAEHFKAQGQYELAAKEFKAIIAADPTDVKSCNDGASFLLVAGQFELAVPFLNQSLKLNDSGFANKWIGQSLVFKGNLHEGIPYLEKAVQYLPEDPQLLFNLGKAYILDGRVDKARITVADLEKVNPHFPDIDKLQNMLDQTN